jgi:hypothetical protein
VNRTEFIRRLVLNELANLVEALASLIAESLAKAAILSSREPCERILPGMPDV